MCIINLFFPFEYTLSWVFCTWIYVCLFFPDSHCLLFQKCHTYQKKLRIQNLHPWVSLFIVWGLLLCLCVLLCVSLILCWLGFVVWFDVLCEVSDHYFIISRLLIQFFIQFLRLFRGNTRCCPPQSQSILRENTESFELWKPAENWVSF